MNSELFIAAQSWYQCLINLGYQHNEATLVASMLRNRVYEQACRKEK